MSPSFISIFIILPVVFTESKADPPKQVCHIQWQFWITQIHATCPEAKCHVVFDLYPESAWLVWLGSKGHVLDKGQTDYSSDDSRLQFTEYTKIDQGTPDPLILRFRHMYHDSWFGDVLDVESPIASYYAFCKVVLTENQKSSWGNCETDVDNTESPKYLIDATFAYKTQRCCEDEDTNTNLSCKANLITSKLILPAAPTTTKPDVNEHIVTTTIESPALVSKDSMILIISIAGAALILLFSFAGALVMIKKHMKKKGKGKESEHMESTKSRNKKYSSIKSKIRSLTSAVSKKKTKIRHKPISVSEKQSTSKSKMRTGTDVTPGDSTQRSPSNSDYDIVRPHYLLMSTN